MTPGEQLLGAWRLVAVTGERTDGTRFAPFGPEPKGLILFAPGGHFSLFQSNGAVPPVAAGDRARATAEEAQGIVAAAIAYYGTYALDPATMRLTVRIEASTLANLVGGQQTRLVTRLDAEELHFTNPRTPAGVTLLTVWERA